jgi:hypothetical protein
MYVDTITLQYPLTQLTNASVELLREAVNILILRFWYMQLLARHTAMVTENRNLGYHYRLSMVSEA